MILFLFHVWNPQDGEMKVLYFDQTLGRCLGHTIEHCFSLSRKVRGYRSLRSLIQWRPPHREPSEGWRAAEDLQMQTRSRVREQSTFPSQSSRFTVAPLVTLVITSVSGYTWLLMAWLVGLMARARSRRAGNHEPNLQLLPIHRVDCRVSSFRPLEQQQRWFRICYNYSILIAKTISA